MTKTHYKSPDSLVEILVSTDDHRFPRHGAPMTIIKLNPRPHTRCREQWDGVTYMLTFDELRAIAQAVALCDRNFTFSMSKSAENKPQTRKEYWQRRNQERVRGNP